MRHLRIMNQLLVVAAVPAFASSSFAAEFSVRPRASIGYQYYDFDVAGSSDVDAKVSYLFGGLGVTGQIGKFFVDLYGQTNLTEGEYETESSIAGVDREATVNRSELNLTAGFAFTRNVTIFGGLKYAKNDIENDFSDDFNQINLDTTYFGPFAGLALAYPISDVGALFLKGSLAYLDGEAEAANEALNIDIDIDGSSIGYGIGLGWSGRFGSSIPALGYGLDLDYSAYKFDGDNDDEFDEKVFRVRADLKYRF